uniref:Misato mitochondrial distribution and morphology regulator 1 n=1 Tax=Varanus komodoensis TaxID=61221 RepID=A0A8D2JB05_VARKO
MSGVREAVTLQLGHYAGGVGAHWWGLQVDAGRAAWGQDGGKGESQGIHHDVLFRTGKTLQGQETYTPRLILMDLKGSTPGAASKGKGNLTTHREDLAPGRSDQAAKAPHVWSDFLRTHLHPRSILTIQQYSHEGESNRLEAFGQGEKLLQDGAYLEELEDRLHFYVEECDYLQGFQVLCDLHNGFSGVGAKVTELLRDEYAGKGVLTWGLTPVLEPAPQRNLYRLMNTVLGIVHLSQHSSLFCPLSLNGSLGLRPEPPVVLPYLQYNASLDYHTSAVLATALDTVTAPYRLQASAVSMAHLAEALNFSGRKVPLTAVASMPFPMAQGQTLPDALCSQQPAVPGSSLSSCAAQGQSRCFAQSVVLRGIGKRDQTGGVGGQGGNAPSGPPPGNLAGFCENSTHGVGWTLGRTLLRVLTCVPILLSSTSHLLQGPCKLLPPYPQYFSPLLNKHGCVVEKPPRASATVESIPVFTALRSSAVLHKALGSFYQELCQVDVRRWASFFSVGVEMDDFRETLDELRTLAQCYKESGSAEESEDDTD